MFLVTHFVPRLFFLTRIPSPRQLELATYPFVSGPDYPLVDRLDASVGSTAESSREHTYLPTRREARLPCIEFTTPVRWPPRAGSTTIMARAKQARPTQREPSSEFISKHDRPRPGGAINGRAEDGRGVVPVVDVRRDAGLLQLVIAVAGIYGSLSV